MAETASLLADLYEESDRRAGEIGRGFKALVLHFGNSTVRDMFDRAFACVQLVHPLLDDVKTKDCKACMRDRNPKRDTNIAKAQNAYFGCLLRNFL